MPWVFVPPCAPPQSFHQDYEPPDPSIRDVNVEMGTILHLQAEPKSTEFIEIDRESAKLHSLHSSERDGHDTSRRER